MAAFLPDGPKKGEKKKKRGGGKKKEPGSIDTKTGTEEKANKQQTSSSGQSTYLVDAGDGGDRR